MDDVLVHYVDVAIVSDGGINQRGAICIIIVVTFDAERAEVVEDNQYLAGGLLPEHLALQIAFVNANQ